MRAWGFRAVGLWLCVGVVPLLMGPSGGGCGRAEDPSEIPDIAGTWEITFTGETSVDIDIGGVAYDPELPPDESTAAVAVDGVPIEFNIDCDSELIQCPHEIMPVRFDIVQDPDNPQSFGVEVPIQECDGEEVEGVCMGTVTERISTAPGTISADGTSFDLLLGGGATGTTGCALLALYVANGAIVSSGTAAMMNKRGDTITNGNVIVAYAGGCLILDEDMVDMSVRAAAVGATLTLSSGYTAQRLP